MTISTHRYSKGFELAIYMVQLFMPRFLRDPEGLNVLLTGAVAFDIGTIQTILKLETKRAEHGMGNLPVQ